MAVSLPNYSQDYPEFNPRSFNPRVTDRPAKRVRRAANVAARAERRARPRQHSRVAGMFRSRLMDDLCAVVVGASGLFFALALARMLLMP